MAWKENFSASGYLYFVNLDTVRVADHDLNDEAGEHPLSSDEEASEFWFNKTRTWKHVNHKLRTVRDVGQDRAMGSKPKYWEYRSSHPHHVLAKQELDTALLVLTVDQAQCILDPSSGPMLFSDSRELSRILRELEDGVVKTWIAASVLARAADNPCYDEFFRRLDGTVRVATQEDSAAPLVFNLANFVPFFGTANLYLGRLRTLKRTQAGDTIDTARWRVYVKTLTKEWSDSNLLATVMIAATVGLLAVPGISWAVQLVLFLSVLFAVGSVFVGMFFVWKHQIHADSAGDVGAGYLRRTERLPGTTFAFALLLALPLALLLWALIAFVLSVVLFSLGGIKNAPDGSPGAVAQRVVSSIGVVVFLCVVVALSSFWRIWHNSRGNGI